MAKIDFGLIVPQGWQIDLPLEMTAQKQFDLVIRMGKEAEEIGYDSVWLFDHFQTSPLIPVFPVTHGKFPVFECWTTLSVLARVTDRIRLGQIVTCVLHRQPAYLGKLSSVVDVMSNGRLELGMGACWNEYELKAYGCESPRPKERIERLGETIEIVKRMWTEEVTNYEGKYFRLVENYNYPKPIQKPHPPILIGGGGEKYTLQIVAKHANKWNYGWGMEGYRKKLQILKQHCSSVGRNIGNIKLTYTSDTIVADTRKEAEDLFVDWRNQQSKALGKEVTIDLEDFRRNQILGSPDETLEILKEIVRELKVSEFILYMPVASSDLRLMKLFYKEVAKPLREYAEKL